MPTYQDPAEREGFLRFFYRGWHPTRFGRLFNRVHAWLAGLGVLPDLLVNLQTKDRRDGSIHSTVLAVGNYQGDAYLVSMLGEQSEWVQNVRAAGGIASVKRGKLEAVQLEEVPLGERAPIIKAWCQTAASGRRHIPVACNAPVSEFESIAAAYPVFRITSSAACAPGDA